MIRTLLKLDRCANLAAFMHVCFCAFVCACGLFVHILGNCPFMAMIRGSDFKTGLFKMSPVLGNRNLGQLPQVVINEGRAPRGLMVLDPRGRSAGARGGRSHQDPVCSRSCISQAPKYLTMRVKPA